MLVGGSWEGFGLFWEALGASWALLGAPRALVCIFSRFSVFLESFVVFCEFFVVVDCFFIVLIVLCWFWLFSAVQPIFKSCQRAERRERSERCEAPGLLLVIFRYFLLFLIVFGCFVIVWFVFCCPANFQIFCLSFACFYYAHISSRFPFLAKTGFFIGLWETFFFVFFRFFF